MSKFRILSLDGGGVKGNLSVQILQLLLEDLEEHKSATELFDCFAGTSIGSINAVSIAHGLRAKDVLRINRFLSRFVFDSPKKRQERGKAKYTFRVLERGLQRFLKTSPATLGELEKKLIIPACRLHCDQCCRWKGEFFHNFTNEYNDLLLSDAALRSSAAPGYFPAYQGYVDGGVFAANPSMLALALALDPKYGGWGLEDITMLSIGTGINPSYLAESADWDAEQWVHAHAHATQVPLLSMSVDTSSDIPAYQCGQLLQERFLRINPILEVSVELDEYQKIPELIKVAKEYRRKNPQVWNQHLDWLKKHL